MQIPEKDEVDTPTDVRFLKIQPHYRFNVFSSNVVPDIRLCGAWLEKVGFAPEQRIKVTARNKLLIIKVDE
jgi:hypothetical protein